MQNIQSKRQSDLERQDQQTRLPLLNVCYAFTALSKNSYRREGLDTEAAAITQDGGFSPTFLQ
jgi:hypothetical protein